MRSSNDDPGEGYPVRRDAQDAAPPIPSHIGPYTVIGVLGRGGMGIVYAGEDPRLGRRIAIKVLPPRSTIDPAWLTRFEREARLLAAMNHPNIATIHSLEQIDDTHFLTMEFVAGDTLASRIASGPLPLAEALDVGRQIASALEAAHRAGVMHLDLKPINIKLTEGCVKLLDFGLARAVLGKPGLDAAQDAETLDGAIQGSPGYMSPEQIRGDRVDPRSDVWAFGCVLFEMLTGKAAFPGRTLPDRIAATLERPYDRAALSTEVPELIRVLIERCLEKEANSRLQSMTLARNALEEVRASSRGEAPAPLPRVVAAEPPTNLPLLMTSFVGREKSMDDLARHLERNRLVTVTGAGGCGKTRLALEVGRRLLPRFPDGVWLAELAPVGAGEGVQHTVAMALGIREDSSRSLSEALRLHLKSRDLLLVLDNCEHLLEPSARLAEALLQGCARVRILATSREPLRIDGESLHPLAPLATPEPAALPSLSELERIESVRLFLERAQAVDAGFVLTKQNAPALAQICRRLDGIPLALELAAAHVGALPAEEIARRLDDRFQLLTTGRRTSLPRHQTLRALIDWSFDHLSEEERRLFRRISVFAGGWSLEEVEKVCAGDGVEASRIIVLHTRLVSQSLVERDSLGERRAGQARYRLLETIREYAREKLREAGEEAETRRRHRMRFFELAVASSAHLVGPEQREWSQRLEVDHDNLRAAIADACRGGTPLDLGAALRMAASLGRYWYGRGRWTEGRSLMKELLAMSAPGEYLASRAQALAWTGWIAGWQGDFDEAWSLNQESLAIRRDLKDRMGIAQSLNNLGAVALERGEFEQCLALHQESLRLRREEGNLRYEAVSLHNIGEVYFKMGDFGNAQSYNEQSLAIRRRVGDLMGIADSLSALGMVAERAGDLPRARVCHEESLANRMERDDPMGIAESLHNLAGIDVREGRLDLARESYTRSLDIRRRLGDRIGTIESLEAIGLLEVEARAHRRAARFFGAAAELRAEMESPVPPAKKSSMEAAIARAREALGDEAYRSEWQRGGLAPLDPSIDLAG